MVRQHRAPLMSGQVKGAALVLLRPSGTGMGTNTTEFAKKVFKLRGKSIQLTNIYVILRNSKICLFLSFFRNSKNIFAPNGVLSLFNCVSRDFFTELKHAEFWHPNELETKRLYFVVYLCDV